MNERQKIRIITFKDFLTLFVAKIWLIVLVPILCIGIVFIQQLFFFTPEYESTATLYILKQENKATYNYTTSDFSLALDVVNDCTYILKSHAVLDEVIESLDLDMSYQDLYRCIETNNPSDTRILEVIVTTNSALLSKQIADQVCLLGTEKITDAMGFEQVNLYENGLLSSEPSNTLSVMSYLLIGIIAGVLTYSVIVIVYIFDDSLDTKEDIERYLGLSILGDIPNANDSQKHYYGYYSAYGSQGSDSSNKKERA